VPCASASHVFPSLPRIIQLWNGQGFECIKALYSVAELAKKRFFEGGYKVVVKIVSSLRIIHAGLLSHVLLAKIANNF